MMRSINKLSGLRTKSFSRNKIIAGMICALLAGLGIFSFGAGSAKAETAVAQAGNSTSTVQAGSPINLDQLQSLINVIRQQIQQMVMLMAKKMNDSAQTAVCGNGACDTGETAAGCAADCAASASSTAATGGDFNFFGNSGTTGAGTVSGKCNGTVTVNGVTATSTDCNQIIGAGAQMISGTNSTSTNSAGGINLDGAQTQIQSIQKALSGIFSGFLSLKSGQ